MMERYHLFFDIDNKAIVIEDDPAALDAAPYDRMVRRYGTETVDAGKADLALRLHGGIAIYADRPAVEVEVS